MTIGQWEGGKGHVFRAVDKKKFNDNFDRIFGNAKDKHKDSGQVETGSNDSASEASKDEAVRK